ncbi:MAG: nuclear transport factor 2 family protein [Alphaproteobacteria bacterium]
MSLGSPAHADPAQNAFARDLDRVQSVRAVKTLQHSYAHTRNMDCGLRSGRCLRQTGQFVFDGQVKPTRTAKGPAAIAAFLRTRYGGGHEGLAADGLSTMMIETPLVNLTADGNRAKARWEVMIFHGHHGQARIEGGVFENDYVRQAGVWKISTARFYPQYEGPYEDGWPIGVAATCRSFPIISTPKLRAFPFRRRPAMRPRRRRRSLRCKNASTPSTMKTASEISRRCTGIIRIAKCGMTSSTCSQPTA